MKFSAIVIPCFAAALSLASGTTDAQQLYNNWNTDACGLTDHASFRLSAPTHLTAIELWYRWGSQEAEVGYQLSHMAYRSRPAS